MDNFQEFAKLPGTERERQWLVDRLETLSVKESIALSAAMIQTPKTMADAIDCILTLQDYAVCFPAGSYERLGEFSLRQETALPKRILSCVDLYRIGAWYVDKHPGRFVGNCYVSDPSQAGDHRYSTGSAQIPEDTDWSVKVRLASPSVPDGVWLRLPDASVISGRPDETALALDALKVRSLENCVLLDVRCCLPELGDLRNQYDDVVELVNDGNDLGYLLEEQGQGAPRFMERFAAALEYEGCRDLRLALDIAQNLRCYEWIPSDSLRDLGLKKLRESGVAEELLASGVIGPESCAAELLESAGYLLTTDESGYITRNSREFIHDRTAPERAEPVMGQL